MHYIFAIYCWITDYSQNLVPWNNNNLLSLMVSVVRNSDRAQQGQFVFAPQCLGPQLEESKAEDRNRLKACSLTSGSWLMLAIGGMTHMWPALMVWASSQHGGWIQRVSALRVRKPDGCPPVYWPNLGSQEVSSLLFLLLVKVCSGSKRGNIDPISFWRNVDVIMREERVGRDMSVQPSLESAICPTLFVFSFYYSLLHPWIPKVTCADCKKKVTSKSQNLYTKVDFLSYFAHYINPIP